jgi:hypothetical protein
MPEAKISSLAIPPELPLPEPVQYSPPEPAPRPVIEPFAPEQTPQPVTKPAVKPTRDVQSSCIRPPSPPPVAAKAKPKRRAMKSSPRTKVRDHFHPVTESCNCR